MARRKNVKRIDPRYFLHETVNRGEEELEEGTPDDEEELEEGSLKKLFGKKGLGMDVKDAARDVGGALADLPSDIKKAWKNRGGPSDEEKWEKIASGAELDESEE